MTSRTIKPALRQARWGTLSRTATAVACATVLGLTALPGLTGTAGAAPAAKPLDPGKRCDELYGLAEDLQGIVDLPEYDASRAKSQWDSYEYVNPGKQWDGLEAPTAEKIAELEQLDKQPPKSKPKDRIWYSWLQARKSNPNAWGAFDDWRDARYIKNAGNDPRGKAFERKVVKDHGLVGPDWWCQKEVEFTDRDGKTYRRKLDAYNPRTGQIVEIKSNGKPDRDQIPKDKAWAKDPKWKDTRFKYVFAEPQKGEAKNFLRDLRQQAPGRVTEYNYRSDKVELAPKGGSRATSNLLQPPGQSGSSRGGASDLIRESRPNPESMRQQLERIRAADPRGLNPRGPGGVDFTTLELRYVGKPVKGKGVDYAFSAKEDPEENSGWGGQAKSQLVSDAFFTWLALTPEKFWVNLNPDQPDKIMDSAFGKTDAGRILLEADLEMKRDYADAMNPTKRPEADRFWKSMPRNAQGVPCWFQVRNWIEPDTAQVREQDGGIYILDTPLKVKSEYMKIDAVPPGSYLCDFDETQKKWAEQQVNTLIIPEVEKRINNDPEYADLRRVYTARVAAEWIRQQDAASPTDYHALINSNNVSRWPLRGENKDWTREKTYQAYLKSLKDGESHWEHDAGGGQYTYGVGGVDFSKQPKRNISGTRFTAEHRYLPRQTKTAVKTLTDNAETAGLLVLGGNTDSTDTDDGGGTKPTPTPTPTPTNPGTPTPTAPATPAPTPPSGGHEPPAKDPNGDLAHTGSDTPFALITGVAAALAAAGATLVWWIRRRRTTEA
ncbi:hypothetical protein ACIQNU_27755 [Streptomyces sp. NPDC091292]|uniref:hypothetical protein n=1 Tax=Streptomyces sp. NPDC091292 TaxID=3365991 RepID=UPI00381B5DE6